MTDGRASRIEARTAATSPPPSAGSPRSSCATPRSSPSAPSPAWPRRADTTGATVVRLATRLGFRGFSELQAAVQDGIGQRLRPAAERIRAEHERRRRVSRTLRAELDNVQRTLAGVDPEAVRPGRRPAGRPPPATSSSWRGDAESGVGAMLDRRPGPAAGRRRSQVSGSDVRGRPAAGRRAAPATVVVAVDLRRYERWVVDHVPGRWRPGATVVAVTDSPLSPLAAEADGRLHRGGRGRRPVRQPRRHPGPRQRPGHRGGRPAAAQRHRRLDAVEAAWRAAARRSSTGTLSREPGARDAGPRSAVRGEWRRAASRGDERSDARRRSGMVASADHLASSAGVGAPAGRRQRGRRRGGRGRRPGRHRPSTMCGMGGDLFALVHVPGEPPAALCAAGRAGSGADADRPGPRASTGCPSPATSARSPCPGCVDGWLALHRPLRPAAARPGARGGHHLRRHRVPGLPPAGRSGATDPRGRRRRRLPGAGHGRRGPAAGRAR